MVSYTSSYFAMRSWKSFKACRGRQPMASHNTKLTECLSCINDKCRQQRNSTMQYVVMRVDAMANLLLHCMAVVMCCQCQDKSVEWGQPLLDTESTALRQTVALRPTAFSSDSMMQ